MTESPAALGTGYLVFFLYSGLLGTPAILLSIAVARRLAGRSTI
jgi:hypothetical protein